MNEIIQAIIEIDQSTRKLKEDTEKVLNQEATHARSIMQDLQKQSQQEMRQEAEAKTQEIQLNQEKQERALTSTLDKQIAIIWRFFDAHREKMAQEWFEKLRDGHGI